MNDTVDCSYCNKEIKTEKELGELWHDGALCKQCKYNEENPELSNGRDH